MDPVCWFLFGLAVICLLVALASCLAGAVPRDQNVPSQGDPLHNINAIGREARREMDRMSDDFVHQQVQRQLKKRSRTHQTRKRRS